MKAHLNLAGGKLTFELTAETPKDLFEQIGAVQEVFEAETECGCCQSDDLRFRVRQVDTFRYFEIACNNQACRARFSFGQSKDMKSLFPKRKGEDGEWLPNRGWSRFQPKGEAVGNGPVAAPSAPKAAPSQAGIAVFATWDDAQNSAKWGQDWLVVAGTRYKLVDGKYTKAA